MSANLPTDAENQWFGDMMILQVLADSEHVNEQEREVLTRWMAASAAPALEERATDGVAPSEQSSLEPEVHNALTCALIAINCLRDGVDIGEKLADTIQRIETLRTRGVALPDGAQQ
jgi:hypothetical protein